MIDKIFSLIKFIFVTAGALAIIFGILWLAVGIGYNGDLVLDKAATQVAVPASTLAPAKFAASPVTITNRIHQTGRLITVLVDTTGEVSASQDNPGVEFAGVSLWKPENTTVTMLVYGTASIGVDLEKASTDIFDNTFTINLPAPQVFGWEMDVETSDGDEESRFVEFDVPFRVGIVEIGAVRPETANFANQQAKASGIEEACKTDKDGKWEYLELANAQAVEMVNALFSDLGFDAIMVNIQAPVSCP